MHSHTVSAWGGWGVGGGGSANQTRLDIPPCGPRPPGLRAALAPSQRSRTTGTNPRKLEGGRTMENDPSQCFFTGAENRIRAGTGAPFARRKEQHHILYGNEHVTMTLLLTSGSNHTNQNDHRPHSTGGEGTRPNKTRRGKQQGQTRQLPT